jgi:hypothetical protein
MAARFVVEKQSYSHGAWRVLHADSREQVWQAQTFDHPNMGTIRIPHPVCFERKRDALAWIASLES